MGELKKVAVEIDSETLAAASAAGLDLSQELNRALRRKLLPPASDAERERAARRWYEENKDAVDWHNKFMAEHGLFSDSVRKF
jgi:post-segregation antitoxin (ccd killing protein)